MTKSRINPSELRRIAVLFVAIACLSVCAWLTVRFEQTANVKMLAAATGRIGLIFGALWLAWPTLRRPANWLPPGFAMLGVLFLGVLAVQPRSVLVLAPLLVGLLTLASIVRKFRK